MLLANGPWMVWNVLLALVPLGIAVHLFTVRRRLSVAWWFGAAAFVAFLPNAPYVMTDAIHLPAQLRAIRGHGGASLVLLGEYALLIGVGFAAYAGSLELLRRFLGERGWRPALVKRLELVFHGLCAVGVLLGRFARFNSWDLGFRPTVVAEHLRGRVDNPSSWKLLLLTFGALVIGTAVTRFIGRSLRGPFDGLARGA